MNDLYYSVLLLRRHLVVTGEAQASFEDIRADVDAGSVDVGVALSTAVAFDGDKGV